MSALTEFAGLKILPVKFCTEYGLSDESGGIRIAYGDDGRARIRKQPSTAHPTPWANGDTRPMRVFGFNRTQKMAAGANKTVLIVEGESDSLTAWYHKRPAIGVPGATMVHTIVIADVEWADCAAIVREPGDAGAKFIVAVAKHLREIGHTGEIVEITLDPHKDISDLHVALGGDRDGFATALDAAIAAATPVSPISARSAPVSASNEPYLVSAAELLNSPGESVDYLIDGLLPRGGIMLLVGKPKCGKSVLGRNAALAAFRGSSFLGRETEKTTVLWLCLEESKSQVTAAFKAMGLREDDPIYFFFGRSARDAQVWLERICEKVHAGLIVIDTWHKFTMVESVNDYGAVNRANQQLQQLARDRGIAQIWIHHSNKGIARNGSEVLGSQALFAAADTLASMDRAEDGTRSVWTIQRSGDDLEPTVVTMNDDQQITIAGTRREVEIARAEQRILDALGTDPMLTKDLKDGAGIRAALFWSALKSLVRKGYVRREGRGLTADPYRYSVGNQPPVSGTKSPFPTNVVPLVPKNYKEPPELAFPSPGTSAEPLGTTGTTGTAGTNGSSISERALEPLEAS